QEAKPRWRKRPSHVHHNRKEESKTKRPRSNRDIQEEPKKIEEGITRGCDEQATVVNIRLVRDPSSSYYSPFILHLFSIYYASYILFCHFLAMIVLWFSIMGCHISSSRWSYEVPGGRNVLCNAM